LIEISALENKYLDILEEKISIEEFEEELIQINYKTKESKHILSNTLNIDFEKLELYQIQELIEKELESENIKLRNVNYEIDLYDLGYISFDFQINSLILRMHNPFKIENFVKLSDAEREKIFSDSFGSERGFLKSLLDSIGTDNFRVFNFKKHEQTDHMTEAKIIRTKEDEYKIWISGHFCHINKEYIKQQMKKAWL